MSFIKPTFGLIALIEKGLSVWYDESTLQIGDSSHRAIENGLRSSKYGIVVLSEAFFNKEWPQKRIRRIVC